MSKRASIYIKEYTHKNPIPAASRIGNLIFSGGIHGLVAIGDPNVPTLEEQCERMFARVKLIVEAGGGGIDDIAKMTFWVTDRDHRAQINVDWVKYFPDAASRPARHTLRGQLDSGMLIQCDFVAVLRSSGVAE
jgi:2-iminobutanoate/2-iminopropanoate deaminase